MEIRFNVTGAERKSLVAAISQELNAPTKYLGAPTFAYEVGGYTIDRAGTLTGEDNRELLGKLTSAGFVHEADEDEAWAEREMRRLQLENENIPDYSNRGQYGGDIDYEDLHLTEREELGLGRERREDFAGESGMREDDVPTPDSLTIEMPMEGFTETALDNLEKLVASKAALIKKALGADTLPLERTETTLKFAWFNFGPEPEKVSACAQFISALCAMAKEQKRITAKEKPVDNEKYAFRCFLLRLGFIGEEYAAARKILLKNLGGNGSFKSGERKPQEAAPVADSGEENAEAITSADADTNADTGEEEAV
jgi:hypothetical protein